MQTDIIYLDFCKDFWLRWPQHPSCQTEGIRCLWSIFETDWRTTWEGGFNVLWLMVQPHNGSLLHMVFHREIFLDHYSLQFHLWPPQCIRRNGYDCSLRRRTKIFNCIGSEEGSLASQAILSNMEHWSKVNHICLNASKFSFSLLHIFLMQYSTNFISLISLLLGSPGIISPLVSSGLPCQLNWTKGKTLSDARRKMSLCYSYNLDGVTLRKLLRKKISVSPSLAPSFGTPTSRGFWRGPSLS